MSWQVRWTVGKHVHDLVLTREDLEAIRAEAAGLKKIAFQKKLLGGGQEPGHVFHLRRG